MRRGKSLGIGVHLANAVVWGPVYRTHLMLKDSDADADADAAAFLLLHLLHLACEPRACASA